MDPFVAVQEEVTLQLLAVNKQFAQWQQQQQQQQQQSVPGRLRTLQQSILTSLQGIDIDLGDLADTVRVVQDNPLKFNLTQTDVQARQRFIRDSQQRIAEIRADLTSARSLKRIEEDQRASLLRQQQQPQQQQPQMSQPTASAAFDAEKQTQAMIMQRQDEQLGDVLTTVSTLREVATVMGREIEDQAVLLDEMEVHVDSTSNKIQGGIKRMQDFIKANSSSKQQYTILCLIIVLIILIVLVFSI